MTLRQSYPGHYPRISHSPHLGAAENNSLGCTNGDSVYRLSYRFPHSTNAVTFRFIGGTTESVTNESWGLDNVTVFADDDPY